MPGNLFGPTFGDDDRSLFGGRPRVKKARFPAAPAAATEEAKASLVDRGVSGLHYVASVLDKPGRAVRGALTGNVREFLGASLPFSDSLGITDPKQATSPDDLLVHYGMLDKADPKNPAGFFSGRGLAGLAAGIATDPLTYASFGTSALTRAGKAAQAVGATPGWTHKALIQGYDHTTDALRASGMGDDAIAHLARSGKRIAPAGLQVEAGQPLAGAVGVGLPFRPPAFTLGHGRSSQAIAGGFDAAHEAIKFAPGVRTVRQWFDTRAGRSSDAIAQKAHEAVADPLRRQIQGEAGVWEYGARRRLGDVTAPGPLGSELEGLNVVRNAAEAQAPGLDPAAWTAEFGRRQADALTPGVADPAALRAHVGANFGALSGIGGEINRAGKGLIEQGHHYGLDPHVLADVEVEYGRRQALANRRAPGVPGAGPLPQRMFPTAGSYDRARQELLKDVPGGTANLNKWSIDPRLSGEARTLDPSQAADHILGDMVHSYGDSGRMLSLTPEVHDRLAAKAADLAAYLHGLDPLHAANRVPLFHPDAIGDHVGRVHAHARVAAGAAGAVEGLAAGARPVVGMAGVPHVPLDQALGRLGLTTHRPWTPVDPADLAHLQSIGVHTADEARRMIATARTDPAAAAIVAAMDPAVAARVQRQGYEGGAARLYEQMARHGAPMQDLTTGAFDPNTFLRQFGVSERDLGSLGQYMQGFVTPHETSGFLSKLDSLQQLFKAFTYPIWPAAHVRNAGSIAYNNAVAGSRGRNYADAVGIMRGQGVGHAGYGAATAAMTPAERASYLSGQAYGHAGIFSGGSFNEVSKNPTLAGFDTLSGRAGKVAPAVPGSGRSTPGGSLVGDTMGVFGEMFRGLRTAEGRNPLGVRGVGGRTDDTFAPLVAGRKVGENIEDAGRLAHFLGGLEKGMTPEVAGAATKKLHFDYGDLTPMESNYFRKLVPFYTFMRKNLPLQVENLIQRPSSIAPTIRAATNNGGQGREGYVPDYLASGPAINLGHSTGPDGADSTRFLSGTGLPVEEALERLKFKQWDIGGHKVTLPDVLGTGQAFLGMANGYMKAPLEMMTDTQLHTGRRLSDLYKPTPWNLYGRIDGPVGDTLSELGQNLPGTRFATTFNKLTDDRKPAWAKALNLLSGVKISDVDTEKAYNIEARKAWEEIARQDPRLNDFTHFYVKDPGADVDPALRAQMEVYSRMQREAHEAAEGRRRNEMLKRIQGAGVLTGGTFRGP